MALERSAAGVEVHSARTPLRIDRLHGDVRGQTEVFATPVEVKPHLSDLGGTRAGREHGTQTDDFAVTHAVSSCCVVMGFHFGLFIPAVHRRSR